MPMTFEDRLTDRGRWRAEHCSVAMVLDLLSTKTVFLVVRECFYGTTRFDDFVERIGSSAPAVSRALRQLEAADIVTRVPYRDAGSRVRDEYRLTEAGEGLLPVLLSMVQWGDVHLQQGRAPLEYVERSSGEPVRVRLCANGIDELRAEEIEIRRAGVEHRR